VVATGRARNDAGASGYGVPNVATPQRYYAET
jgi:hypothetical protein